MTMIILYIYIPWGWQSKEVLVDATSLIDAARWPPRVRAHLSGAPLVVVDLRDRIGGRVVEAGEGEELRGHLARGIAGLQWNASSTDLMCKVGIIFLLGTSFWDVTELMKNSHHDVLGFLLHADRYHVILSAQNFFMSYRDDIHREESFWNTNL